MQKKYRLAKREHFHIVFKYGKSVVNHQFVLYYRSSRHIEHFRLGVSVSKKIGNAVVRNRIRRKMKEIVRLHKDEVARGYDLIMIARKPVTEMDYHQMEKSILHILRKASIINIGKKNTHRKSSTLSADETTT
ncbi:ribonuclease P protein component [Marinicrinis lubricantis]|uniref:Ribonuclease P protein component n=1 Tax=Marinicrinis lubricantis TaxID=2086470 RepID=A0ABW1IGW1_9BACL